MDFNKTVVVFLVLVATCGISLHMLRHHSSKTLLATLSLFALFSLWFFTDYGKFHWVPKKDPAFMEANGGSSDKRTYFHWHEIYHYYLGAKYYRELNNNGLYEAVALADSESGRPMITVKRMRDLSNRTKSISMEEALDRARAIHRPNFTDERWIEFTEDLEYMKSIAANDWLNLGMYDAGFNPPPAWCVLGTPIANMIPISSSWFELPPTWDQSEFLPLLDVLLMAIALGFFWRSFGTVPALLFAIIFGTSFISSGGWIAGGFLRYTWLFAIIMALCMIKENRWMLAGIFMGLATIFLVFPAVFAVGTGIALLWRYHQKKPKAFEQIMHYSIGFGGAILTLFLVSLVMFGFSYWEIFFKQISAHSNLFFVWHIGYKRIAVWDTWVPNQDFWWHEGLARFQLWNQRLLESWNSQRWFQWPFMLGLLSACVWSCRKLSAEETTIFFGGLVLFLFAIPANYYYAYIALVPALFFACHKNWREEALLCAFLTLWFVLYLIPNFGRDDLIKNYRICASIFVFFLFWIGIRFFDEKSRLSNYLSKSFRP